MNQAPIVFYFDYVSPFAFLASRRVEQIGLRLGRPIADDVRAALAGLDLDVEDLLTRADTPAIKSALRAATDQAAALGVFGVPSSVVDAESLLG
jgi:2-hydroxychromene-2-carboxylate isomerase